MAIGRAIGNLLGGVSQQPENSRFANMAEESVNTYASLTQGLDKRRPTVHLGNVVEDATVNGYFHAIKRSPTEQYGLWIYRIGPGAHAAKVFIKAFNLLTGANIKIEKDGAALDPDDTTTYFGAGGQIVDFDDGIQAMTVADNTFLLNRNRTVAVSTAPEDKFEDEAATLQITAGHSGTQYDVNIDGMEFYYKTPQAGGDESIGEMWKTEYIAERLVYGAYMADAGPTQVGMAGVNTESVATDNTWVPNSGSGSEGGATHPIYKAFNQALNNPGTRDNKAWCYGMIQSGKCTHLIYTHENNRAGWNHSDDSQIPAASDASANKRQFRLYGDKSKWASGTGFKMSIEYYNSTTDKWEVSAATGAVIFNNSKTTSWIADKVEEVLQAVVDANSEITLTTDIECDVVSAGTRWFDYNITVDYSTAGDTPIRNIFVSEALYEVQDGTTNYALRLKGNSIAVKKMGRAGGSGSYDGMPMNLEFKDGQGSGATKIAYKTEIDFSSLPNEAMDGQIVMINGANEDGADDYYVKFVATLSSGSEASRNEGLCWGQHFGRGVWNESTLNRHKESIDSSTMPVVLESKICEADDSPIAGLVIGEPYFSYKAADWSDRTVGDSESNKQPSFVGDKISGITYHHGRLGLMSGESLAMSEAAGPFNFYRTTANVLRDTDRIDVTARYPKVSVLKSAVTMQENLILFADQTQFLLTSGGGPLTPATAGLDLVSSYESTSDVAPQVAGFSAYFPFSRGSYSGVRRLHPAGGAANLFTGEDVTAHVPNYIKNKIKVMAISEMEKCLVMVTDDADALYIYKWADVGGNRVQSSWFKHEFSPTTIAVGDDTYGTIRGVQIIDSTVYVLLTRGYDHSTPVSHIYLEKIELEDGVLDIATTETTSDVWYVSRLDRRLTDADMLSDDYSDPDTTIVIDPDLNVKYLVGSTVELIYRHGVAGQTGGQRFTGTVTGTADQYNNTIVFSGQDHDGKKFYLGIPYTMRHTLSKPYIEGGKTGALITGRMQIRRAFVDVADSGYFSAEVTSTGRTKASDFHPSEDYGTAITSAIESFEDVYTVPIFARAGEYVFDLVNDTPYPSRFVNLEYEGTYTSRSRRIG